MYLNQMQRERAYGLGWRVSTVIRDVLETEVGVRKGYIMPKVNADAMTLFRDVHNVPYEYVITDQDRALFSMPPGTVEEDRPTFYRRIFDAICQYIVDCWDPRKQHVMLVSSGWDTRIISWALKTVAEQRGESWLGDMAFVTAGPETKVAREVLRYEGWRDTNCLMLDDPGDWYYPVLDPERIASTLNGAQYVVPITRYWLAGLAMERTGWDRQDTQTLSGFGSDYAMIGAGKQDFFGRMRDGYRACTSVPLRSAPDEILPWMSRPVVKIVRESSVRGSFDLRPQLAASLDERLGQFERLTDKWPAFPDKLQLRARDWFKASWYGRNVGGNLSAIISNWSSGAPNDGPGSTWSHWTAACYCEHLLRDGYKLEAV